MINMLNNYFLILELSRYLNKNISGKNITEIFSQEKNKLVISLSDNASLEFSADNELIYLVAKKDYSKSKKNYINLFQEIYGEQIKNIYCVENERAICFVLGNDYKLIFTFIPNKANVYILKNDVIENVFKNRLRYVEKTYRQIFEKKLTKSGLIFNNVKDYLKSNYYLFGKNYTAYVLKILNIKENDAFNDDIKNKIDFEFEKLIKSFTKPEYLIYKSEAEINPSLVNLNPGTEFVSSKYNDINELINDYLKYSFQGQRLTSVKEHLTDNFEKISLNIEKKIKSIEKQIENSENSLLYKTYGDIILSNSGKISKGDKIYESIDESAKERIRIPLNPALKASDNAQKYYDKYKRQKNSILLLQNKMKALRLEKEENDRKFKEIELNTEFKELKKMEKKQITEEEDETTGLFRKFILNESFEVWVGKNSASNDLLTMRYSAQNDLWFHVRGASGSHTVLKKNNKNEIPDKKIIETAASIAAYYSKARNATSVPVAYCERKFVKKKKGFKEGSVVMEREKVIFVKPTLPGDVS